MLVPGRGLPKPEHWMQRWAAANPSYLWAPRPPGPPFILEDRVQALHAAIAADDEPAVLIAHSGGCLSTVVWAQRHVGPVQAALLVTPPYVDKHWPSFGLVPRQRLPFRTILVASHTDPYTSFAQFQRYADDWGAELFDAGEAGHLETASGYGPWPDGERLVETLT
ncbi:alpha/beta hydrolase [Rhizocola hellebori]|uniref:Alpha/beta hydrolase n=1 Tax=Rhizocola hellebori TaxID=1392758 RepID=A0A8J3Q453_9ACTN|nr:alpha/beta hydrolase [Rhizocola hellebori]